MHLTNYSLNKLSKDFVHTNASNTGSKRTYRSILQVLQNVQSYVDILLHYQGLTTYFTEELLRGRQYAKLLILFIGNST